MVANASKKPSRKAPPGVGSNPSSYRYHYQSTNDDDGTTKNDVMPVPWWFNPSTAKLYHNLSMRDDDIIVSSGTKMGTTWITNLLVSLLYEYDDEGKLMPDVVADREKYPGRLGQTYPDAMYPTLEEKERDEYGIYDRHPRGREKLAGMLGDFVFDDFLTQPGPRLFVSHLFGRTHLPKELFDEYEDNINGNSGGNQKIIRAGKGRFIVTLRNLKDTLISLHNFQGTPLDDWHGNEHGPGSFRRFILQDDCPTNFGSTFQWVRETAKVVEAIGSERALVVYYENLILDFSAQLRRINDFLDLGELTEAKAAAIHRACSFDEMGSSQMRTRGNCRKGGICGWKDVSELDEGHWAEFDRTFDEVLSGVELAEPMRFFQWRDVPGMPSSSLKDCDLDTDPRDWPPYLLVMLKEGMVVPDPYVLDKDRPTQITKFEHSQFSSQSHIDFDETNSDGSPRYHLLVSASCPLASSLYAARHLLRLEDVLSADVADGQSGAGHVFLNGASCHPWKDREIGPFWLHEAYQLSNPTCTTRIQVPVLWDTVTQRIVSNDSWEIMKLMAAHATKNDLAVWNDELGAIAQEGLFPDEMTRDSEEMFSCLQKNLFDASQFLGMDYLRTNGHVESPLILNLRKKVLATLEELEGLLGKKRFLLGNNVTGVDVYLAMFLFMLDACYWDAYGLRYAEGFKGSVSTGDGYPNIQAYSREMYCLLKSTLNFPSFRHDFCLARAIENTRQCYSCHTSFRKSSTHMNRNMPNLKEIVASLEKPAGDRPLSSIKETTAPGQPAPIECQGVRMPAYFRHDTWEVYRNMNLREDDIILSSGVKMGTTWVTKILSSLLYDFDENGNTTEGYMDEKLPNRLGQTYPEAMPPTREIERLEMEQGKGNVMRERVKKSFGDFTMDEIMNQPSPRLFSSHLQGKKLLPKKLFDELEKKGEANGSDTNGDLIRKGKGRLIVVVRNLKDSLVSLHHFRGVPKDGWYGNEHGPGSFKRWLDLEKCSNSFGNAFQWVKMSADAIDSIGPERSLVIYYEALKLNFDAQLQRINDFLGLPRLSDAKSRAICEVCSVDSMKTSVRFKGCLRRGIIGDYKNHLDDAHWKEIDRTFNIALNGVKMAEPLRFFQSKDISGLPPLLLKDCDLNTDPRSWPPHLMVTLREGMIVPDALALGNFNCMSKAHAVSTPFKSTIRPGRLLRSDETNKDGSPRFHLFVSGSCPMAASVAAVVNILGLERLISMDMSDGESGAGWVFLNGATCTPWKNEDRPFWLHEAYQLADPFCTTNIYVPVLWDTETQKIVSNDSWEIMRMLCDAASDLGLCMCPKNVLGVIAKQGVGVPTLFPENMMEDIDQMFANVIQPLIDAVFGTGLEYLRNGCIETQLVVEGQMKVFALLEQIEQSLGDRRYLLGNNLTGVDVASAFCLLQFDACYWDAFGLRNASGYKGHLLTGDIYPNLKAYAQDMYRMMKSVVHVESFRQLFRIGQAIEFTPQSYSVKAAADETLNVTMNELPDLHNIVSILAQQR